MKTVFKVATQSYDIITDIHTKIPKKKGKKNETSLKKCKISSDLEPKHNSSFYLL
jgi:hypothetical protein